MAIPIGTIGTVPTLTIGGRVFTDLTNLITLVGYVTASAYTGLRRPNGTSGYQVTAGKTLKLETVGITGGNNAGLINATILYGDNDVGIAGSVPTNPIYLGGGSNTNRYLTTVNTAGGVQVFFNPNFNILAAKYATAYSDGISSFVAYGYET